MQPTDRHCYLGAACQPVPQPELMSAKSQQVAYSSTSSPVHLREGLMSGPGERPRRREQCEFVTSLGDQCSQQAGHAGSHGDPEAATGQPLALRARVRNKIKAMESDPSVIEEDIDWA